MLTRRRLVAGLFAAGVAMPAAAVDPAVFTPDAFAAAQKAGKSILVDVAAPWCPVCKRQRPLLEAILSDPRFKDVQRFDIDFDTQKDALRAIGARMQSTLIVYKGAQEKGRSIGQTQREWLEDLLDKML